MKTLLQENDHLNNFFDSVFGRKSFKNTYVKKDVEKIIYDDGDQELKKCGDLEGMKGGTHLDCVTKSGVHTMMSNTKYLAKFCS
jgi:hypothetical protein